MRALTKGLYIFSGLKIEKYQNPLSLKNTTEAITRKITKIKNIDNFLLAMRNKPSQGSIFVSKRIRKILTIPAEYIVVTTVPLPLYFR